MAVSPVTAALNVRTMPVLSAVPLVPPVCTAVKVTGVVATPHAAASIFNGSLIFPAAYVQSFCVKGVAAVRRYL